MQLKKVLRLLLVAVMMVPALAMGQEQELWERLPEEDRAVNDFADLISPAREVELERFLTDSFRQTGTPVVVVTVKNLEGGQIDDFTNRLYERWGLGVPGTDKGALLLVALEERKVRIEPGYGTEPVLTDVVSGRIIREVIAPAFQQGKYEAGIEEATRMIVGIIAAEEGVSVTGATTPRKPQGISIVGVLFLFLFGFIFFRRFMKGGNRVRTRRNWRGGHYGGFGGGFGRGGGFGGGGFGGGGGGGGFGGFGGGMSGGGGASGGW